MEDILIFIDNIEGFELKGENIDIIKKISKGPLAVKLFISLCVHPQTNIASKLALSFLSNLQDVGAITEIISWLVRGGNTASIDVRDMWKCLIQIAEDKEMHYAFRSQALLGALYLSQKEKSLLRRLQGVLLDTDLQDNAKYLRHVVKIIGTILSHEIDEDLQNLLHQLSNVEEAKDEAWLEIGMHQLRLGLEATNYHQALSAFIESYNSFEKSLNASERRVDADLFSQCINVLIQFLENKKRDSIEKQIEGIQKATFNYLAFVTNSDRESGINSWVGLINQERIHWSLLSYHLGRLDLTFKKNAWLKAAEVIENQLLIIFTASRTLLNRDCAGGLESYLRPKLINQLQKDRVYLNYLEQWIDENSTHFEFDNANLMKDEILNYKEGSLLRSPSDAVIDSSTITAILEKGHVSIEKQKSISKDISTSIDRFYESLVNPKIDDILSFILKDLEKNKDYQKYSHARDLFNIILLYTVRFLVSRMNDSVSTIPHMAYLFKRNENDLPKENDLQADYYGFLKSSDIGDMVDAEVKNISAGRADILFKLNGTKIIAELKQEKIEYSNDEIIKKHGAQEISYDSTSITFGILMVLDLFDRKGGQPHLTEQISVHHITPTWRETEHSIVLFRVQGYRKTPSSIKL